MIEERVDAAWDGISKAVAAGLKVSGVKVLADVVPVDAGAASEPALTAETVPTAPSSGTVRIRASADPLVVDYRFQLPVTFDELAAVDASALTKWAAGARQIELYDVLSRLAATGTAKTVASVDELLDTQPGGWGQVRCVAIRPEESQKQALQALASGRWDEPVALDGAWPALADGVCVLFRKDGGPYVRRSADLTLGWLPGEEDGVVLVLSERLEIVESGPDTVVRAQFGAAPQPPARQRSTKNAGGAVSKD